MLKQTEATFRRALPAQKKSKGARRNCVPLSASAPTCRLARPVDWASQTRMKERALSGFWVPYAKRFQQGIFIQPYRLLSTHIRRALVCGCARAIFTFTSWHRTSMHCCYRDRLVRPVILDTIALSIQERRWRIHAGRSPAPVLSPTACQPARPSVGLPIRPSARSSARPRARQSRRPSKEDNTQQFFFYSPNVQTRKI